jgi:methionyl-tRNA synthetase
MKKYLVTSALPYANGPIHPGHLVGAYLPADIYTRHLRMNGEKVIHISGSDEYGVAIMLNAQKAGQDFGEYVDHWHKEHKRIFEKFEVDFDFFGQTHLPYHKEEVLLWFKALHEKGLIEPEDSQQLMCNDCKNHLPDRFVEGKCYNCGYDAARGDECPNCGIWIEPIKLINPVCKICGSRNISVVTVTQWYLRLSKFHGKFRDWFEGKQSTWRNTVYPFVDALTKDGLQDRAITRDLKWGIDVPLTEAQGKKFYVWFDAPIGYVSNTKQYLKESKSTEHYLNDWWKNKDTEIVHFLAKDNIIFHAVIFPVMAMASDRINPPTDIPANQYLTLEGKQFSKSAGWYIDLEKAHTQFGTDLLRYYLISIMPETSDSSFSWKDFALKVNGELANNIGNLITRCLKFFEKNWPEGITDIPDFSSTPLGQKFKSEILEHQKFLNNKEFKKGLEKVMSLGHATNLNFSDAAPWAQFKVNPELAAKTIGETSQAIIVLAVLFTPYLPGFSEKMLKHFDLKLSDEDKTKIYKGDFSPLKKNLKIVHSPTALVPKIEDSVVVDLEANLVPKAT